MANVQSNSIGEIFSMVFSSRYGGRNIIYGTSGCLERLKRNTDRDTSEIVPASNDAKPKLVFTHEDLDILGVEY